MTLQHKKTFLLFFFVSISVCGIAQNIFNAKVTAEKVIEHYYENYNVTYENYVDTAFIEKTMENLTRKQIEQVIEVITDLFKEENQHFKTAIISFLKEQMPKKDLKEKTKIKNQWYKEQYEGYAGVSFPLGMAYSGFYNADVRQSAIGAYLFGRHGKVMGWGWNAQIGYSWGKYFERYGNGLYISATVKYFPWKFIYLGIAGNMVGEYSNTDVKIENGNFKIDSYRVNVFGISLLAGLDHYFPWDKEQAFAGSHLGLGFGVTYMPIINKVVPTIRITVSAVAFAGYFAKK